MYASFRTDEHREAMAERARERWAKQREQNAERDAEIIRIYKEDGKSIKEVGRQFGIAYQTARDVLLRAEMQGRVKLRPKGGSHVRPS